MTTVVIIAACLVSGYVGYRVGSRRRRVFILRPEMSGDDREYCPWIG